MTNLIPDDDLPVATTDRHHNETLQERFEHLVMLRQVQSEKPAHAKGFLAFIAWPFQDENTNFKESKRYSQQSYFRRVYQNDCIEQNYVA